LCPGFEEAEQEQEDGEEVTWLGRTAKSAIWYQNPPML
jgi:hypothetical protein